MTIEGGRQLTVTLDADEAADWVMGTSDVRAEVELLARQANAPVSVRASIGASLGIIWPDGKHSNLPDDRIKERVRQQFKEEQYGSKLDSK